MNVDHLTLEELQGETVTFGQKFNGSSFEETWQDQEWVQFMISRYQNSGKEAHKRYMKYVELKIEALEQSQMVVPRQTQGGGQGRPQGKAKAAAKTFAAPFSHLFAGRERLGHSFRAVRDRDYEPSANASLRGVACDAIANAESGECPDEGNPTPRGAGDPRADRGGGLGSVREDWDGSVLTAMHHEASTMKQLIFQFSQELDEICKCTRPMGKPWNLGEVMCSKNSPLTQQMLQQGQSAFRFGYEQGDLAQSSGRAELFRMMARHRPKHVWYSPTCGPWSAWSQFNSSRSTAHQEEYQQKRHDLLYQLALGITLYRHQISKGNHFHWEQPRRSIMFQSPLLAEIHGHTQACQFDMCQVGQLQDPENGMFMQKGMTVLTSFEPLFQQLHGRSCNRQHDHQPIEGTRKLKNGERILRTKYTEVYPRRFCPNRCHRAGKREPSLAIQLEIGDALPRIRCRLSASRGAVASDNQESEETCVSPIRSGSSNL